MNNLYDHHLVKSAAAGNGVAGQLWTGATNMFRPKSTIPLNGIKGTASEFKMPWNDMSGLQQAGQAGLLGTAGAGAMYGAGKGLSAVGDHIRDTAVDETIGNVQSNWKNMGWVDRIGNALKMLWSMFSGNFDKGFLKKLTTAGTWPAQQPAVPGKTAQASLKLACVAAELYRARPDLTVSEGIKKIAAELPTEKSASGFLSYALQDIPKEIIEGAFNKFASEVLAEEELPSKSAAHYQALALLAGVEGADSIERW